MKLKEIKPGMVIHCKTKDEMKQAIEQYNLSADADYIWNYKSYDKRRNCLSFDRVGNYSGFCTREYYEGAGYEITEFSDLIIHELTAEEAIRIKAKLCHEHGSCDHCPIYLKMKNNDEIQTLNCAKFCRDHADQVIEVLEQWRLDHENENEYKNEKKEPEIETVNICRIMEIQSDGCRRCVHEEEMDSQTIAEMEDILKHYCMEHEGDFISVLEVVSRVKEEKR